MLLTNNFLKVFKHISVSNFMTRFSMKMLHTHSFHGSNRILFTSDTYQIEQNVHACRAVNRKSFLRNLILSNSEMAPRTRPNIWYMALAHQVVDPSFLLLTHTPDSIHRTPWRPLRLPRHSFPFYSLPPENPWDFLGFLETTDWKVAEQLDRAPRCRVC